MTIPATQLPSMHERQAQLRRNLSRDFSYDRSDDWRDESALYLASVLEQTAQDLRELAELERALSGQVDKA